MTSTLISILGGLAGMFGWGTSDFLANQASEKVGHLRTLFWSQVAGILLVGISLLFFGTHLPAGSLLPLTLLLGVVYALGYLFFYQGFEKGNVSVISAVINLQTVLVIAVAFFLFNQRISLIQIPAIFLMLMGILAVSVNIDELKQGRFSLLAGVKETLVAVVLFGLLYWPMNEYLVERADWLTITFLTKAIALITILIAARTSHQTIHLPKLQFKQMVLIAAIGIFEALAVIGVNYSLKYGDSIIVAPVSSSLTVVTVTLSILFLKEKISRLQAAGIAVTILGIILTAF